MLFRHPPRRIVPCRLNGRGVMRFPTLPSSSRWFFCPRRAIGHCSFNIPSDVSADLDRIDTGPSFANQNVMKRVLIADDLEDQRELYVTSLALAGFVVDEAADGGQVIDVVTDHRPDVIVLDLAMPVLDGLQVCRRLKANDRTAAIPIIIVTGNTLPGVRETVERAGADGFLARPCSPDTLVAAIRQHTGEAAGGALRVPYPAGNVSGGDPSREIEISRPAQAADALVGLAVPSTRFRRPRYTTWLYAMAAAVVLAIGITLGAGPIASMQRGTRLNGVAEASVDQHQRLARGLMPPAIAGVSPQAVE